MGDADLTALGQQRAMALQQALLTGTQIDPERVFLVANDKARKQGRRGAPGVVAALNGVRSAMHRH